MHNVSEPDDHDDFGGLERDLPRLVGRRRALQIVGGIGLIAAVGCSDDNSSTATTSSSSSGSTTSTTAAAASSSGSAASSDTATLAEVPDETGGPYPGDGSNGPNVLTDSGIVRSDIRSSYGAYSGKAVGIDSKIKMRIGDAGRAGKALAGAAVYVWHCDIDGNYSLYTAPNANYLRGVQVADKNGNVTFQSVFPACYPGRWPHVHFEVYESLDAAQGGSQPIKTSQIALPEAACREVYSQSTYAQSLSRLDGVSLSTDMVFSDDLAVHELGSVTGDASRGYSISLNVNV